MNIGEILIWESTNALLLIPVVIGLAMLSAVATRAARFHGTGLVVSDWPSAGESPLASPVAKIRGVMGRGRGHRFC